MSTRIVTDILLLLGAFILPPWALLILGLVCIFFFVNFYEIFFIALTMDILYGLQGGAFHIPVYYSLIAGGLFVGSHVLKKYLKFYH